MSKKQYKLNEDSFMAIRPFMTINLKLSGVSLLAYSLIYGISINKGVFYGGHDYLALLCNCSRRQIITALQNLEKSGLVRKKRTAKGNFYVATPVETKLKLNINAEDFEDGLAIFDEKKDDEKTEQCEKTSHSNVKKLHISCEKTSHNKIIKDNKKDLKTTRASASVSEPPTPKEVFDYYHEKELDVPPKEFWRENNNKHWKHGLARNWKKAYDAMAPSLDEEYDQNLEFNPDDYGVLNWP